MMQVTYQCKCISLASITETKMNKEWELCDKSSNRKVGNLYRKWEIYKTQDKK